MSKPILVVVGATGGQGGSVVSSFLADGKYTVRGLTRNPSSEKAKALQARGVQPVAGDLNDEDSLIAAFKEASIIFAVTDYFEPFIRLGPKAAEEIEEKQGLNLARAAAKTPTLRHYIWSTLPNPGRLSNGKYMIPHFVAKNKIDDYIKSDSNLFAKTTFLWIAYFASNIIFPLFKPSLLKTAGKYLLLHPCKPNTPVISVGDQTKNVGSFVLAIANKPEITLPGKFVFASTDSSTAGGILELWGKVTGKQTEFVQIGLEQYDRLFPSWGREMGMMMQFWDEYGDKSWTGEEVLDGNALGLKRGDLIGLEECMRGLNFNDDI